MTDSSIEEALAALDELPGEHAPTSPAPENQAEHAWESLNVAGFPGLEDVNGLRNARWGFVAGYLAAAQTIRSALTSAAQEQKALDELLDFSPHVGITSPGGHVNCWTATIDSGKDRKYFDGPTRLAAIVAAGEYCRAEREKR